MSGIGAVILILLVAGCVILQMIENVNEGKPMLYVKPKEPLGKGEKNPAGRPKKPGEEDLVLDCGCVAKYKLINGWSVHVSTKRCEACKKYEKEILAQGK